MPSVTEGLVIAAMACVMGCAFAPPPAPVVIHKTVYVEAPTKERVVFVEPPSWRQVPGEGIAPSPMLLEAEQRRADNEARRLAATPPPAPEVVYVPTERPYYPGYYPGAYVGSVYDRQPETNVIVVHDHHHGRDRVRHHSRNIQEKRIDRCDRRATKWARDRCIKRVAR